MATPNWVTYGNEGGAKASQIAQLRDLFGSVGPLTQENRTYMAYGGDQMIETPYQFYNSPNLANVFSQLGLTGSPDQYAYRNVSGSGFIDAPTGLEYVLPSQQDPEREGKTGAYRIVLDPSGSVSDVRWEPYEQHGGWFSENMDWLGPLMVGGLATLGTTVGGAAAGVAAPAAAGPGYFGGISSTPAAAIPGMGGGAGLNIGAAGPLAAGSAMMPTLGAAGTAALASGGGAAATAATGGGLSELLRSIRGGGGGDGKGGSDLGFIASLINAYSQNRQGSAQEDWADRLYQDRSQFLEPLVRTYSNPEEYLSGPEYTAAAGITLDQLERKDAARGRLATDVERQKLMQDYALQSLGNYRSGLATAAGLSPTQGLADLFVTGQANKYGTFNAPISELARILEGNNSFDFDDLLDDIIGGWF